MYMYVHVHMYIRACITLFTTTTTTTTNTSLYYALCMLVFRSDRSEEKMLSYFLHMCVGWYLFTYLRAYVFECIQSSVYICILYYCIIRIEICRVFVIVLSEVAAVVKMLSYENSSNDLFVFYAIEYFIFSFILLGRATALHAMF